MSYPNIRLGLCCRNITLKYINKPSIYSSRTLRLSGILNEGIENAKKIAIQNIVDMAKILIWNKNHGIDVFRMNSDLISHVTNPIIVKHFGDSGEEYSSLEFMKSYFEKVGHLANIEGIRLTFHPAQFVQLASPSYDIFLNSVKELQMHAKILDMMNLPNDSVINIHLGGVYDNREKTINRFIERFKLLPNNIQKRLTIENDEKCHNADAVISVCEQLNIPMVFDIFHYHVYSKFHPDIKQKSINELIPRILKTWNKRNIRPKFHLSEQYSSLPIGSHSFLIEKIPDYLLSIPEKYGMNIDIMIEAKGKEIAIGKLHRNYPNLKSKYAYDIPNIIPKSAKKDLKIPDELIGCVI